MGNMNFDSLTSLEDYLTELILFLGNGRPEDYDLELIISESFHYDQDTKIFELNLDTLEFLEVIESSVIDPSFDY